MRSHWTEMQNGALERAGAIDRVDHRSLEAQREEAEQERDQLQERATELETVIDGYVIQLVEPGNLERMHSMPPSEQNNEWDSVQRAEWDRKTVEQQLHFATIKAAKLDRTPQVKLGPSASAMERKAMQKARERGTDYAPVTERGESIQDGQQQRSFVEDARERFDAACSAYGEARELGFSRTRSAYEAAREALLFGVEQKPEKPTMGLHRSRDEPRPLRGVAQLKAEVMEGEERSAQRQERMTSKLRVPEASIWDALDGLGRDQTSTHDQSIVNEAIQRVQERTTEQLLERKKAADIERAKLEREKTEQERDRNLGLGYGMR